jgi:hypothetical protein
LGVAPANTTLTLTYLKSERESINVSAGSLSRVSIPVLEFPRDDGLLNSADIANIRAGLECGNEKTIVSDSSLPTSEEIKYRTYASKASQLRSVTRNDYEAYCYMMPKVFGSIKRATVINDPSSSNRRLSLYTISADASNNFVTTNGTTKENLKHWLNKNKMLNDNIDIYDAKIVNIGFDYEIIVDPTRDKAEVLNSVNRKIRSSFSEKMYVGEPFYLTNVYNAINKVDGVVDTTKVKPNIKLGTGYSNPPITIEDMKSNDGTYLKAPRNVVFEIKFFNSDIRGTAV